MHWVLVSGLFGAVALVSACASTSGRVRSISLLPPDPPASPQAVKAVTEADWVVFGPGSWFTSVLPHLQVPELARALVRSPAHRVVVLNLSPQRGETDGFAAHTYLDVLAAHCPELRVDTVLADPRILEDDTGAERLSRAARGLGAELLLEDLADAQHAVRHDPLRLASAFDRVFRTGGRGVDQ
jgi:uncharacterized cofD-like protein